MIFYTKAQGAVRGQPLFVVLFLLSRLFGFLFFFLALDVGKVLLVIYAVLRAKSIAEDYYSAFVLVEGVFNACVIAVLEVARLVTAEKG